MDTLASFGELREVTLIDATHDTDEALRMLQQVPQVKRFTFEKGASLVLLQGLGAVRIARVVVER